jgi:hypothetical protein
MSGEPKAMPINKRIVTVDIAIINDRNSVGQRNSGFADQGATKPCLPEFIAELRLRLVMAHIGKSNPRKVALLLKVCQES